MYIYTVSNQGEVESNVNRIKIECVWTHIRFSLKVEKFKLVIYVPLYNTAILKLLK